MTFAPDAIPGGILTLSPELRILAANRAIGEIVGRDPDSLVGQPLDVLLTAPSRILFQTHVYPALKADGRVEEVFLTLRGDDDASIPILLNAVRSSEPDGAGYQVVVVRILARARWETELLDTARALEGERTAGERLAAELTAALADLAARQAEKARNDQFRDAFVGVLGHELRAPITTIFGMSDVLRRRHATMDGETLGRHLEDVAEEANRLRRLTEDLLVLSRAEAGQLRLADDPMMIGHVVAEIVDHVRGRADDHVLTIDAEERLPVVLGDEPFVGQVVRNLLSNAIKYSPAGTTVRVTIAPEAGGVAVRVTDQGPGLDDQAEQLFEVFYRAPDAVGIAGAGIGLFVCRQLIEAMGGRIWAAPAPDTGGAEFGFWLPAAIDEG